MNLSGRVALITGAGQGIGEACARVFAERGAMLVLLDKNKETLPRVATSISELGTPVIARIIDLTHTLALKKLIKEIKKETVIDILVNNAGFDRPGTTQKIDKKEFNEVMGIHVVVPFLLSKWLLHDMRLNKWGRIINISSVYGTSGAKGEVAYSTAKAAVIGLTKTLAREAGQDGVTVNAIVPGLIRTPPIIQMPDKYKDPIIHQTLLRRIGEPEEVARVAAFLASEDASYITGTTITVSGGWGI
ncbi:MAG TPA: SDR family NAD(P)-dependent oxidoreductase [Syntrophorhabdaceae bacterium]|nr:SDR family NAD(P)-dependent oxidoreductase [Syntrophorhabdaceae bacterium]